MSASSHNKPKPINSDQIIRKHFLAPSKHDILMARTSDCTPRDISKLNEGDIKSNDDKSFIEGTLDKFASKSGKDLIFGTMSGWIAGLTLVRVGKIAAFGLGGGIILLHFASECGYINVNWERVKEAATKTQCCIEELMCFAKKNSCYSVGFFGGFFFGVASA